VEKVETTLDEFGSLLPVFVRYGLGRNRFRDVIVRHLHDGAGWNAGARHGEDPAHSRKLTARAPVPGTHAPCTDA
jgi:hypothetical protein